MTIRPRTTLTLLIALLALIVAGCGGGDDSGGGKKASSSTDVNELLKDTFSGKQKIDSGKLNLTLRVDAQGGSSSGPISVSISGPFQSQGKGKLPKLDVNGKVEGAGQNISAGLVSTGDKGYVSYNGTNYVVSDAVFSEFKKGYEQAQSQADKQQGQSLATLGIDPQKWLKNPKNEGEVSVGGDEAIKITGDVDIPKLLDDVDTALQKARSLGVQGSAQLPEKLTDAQKKQVTDAIKGLSVEIDTGKDDRILRRMLVNLDVADSGQSAKVALDLQITDVNEDQDISAPSNPKPFNDLLSQFGGLGLGSGSSSSGSGSSSGSAANLEKYSKCIEDAGNDASKARKCADLLTP
jgi:hypothetical protein